MQPNTLALMQYWRDCFQDSQSLSGKYSKKDFNLVSGLEKGAFRQLTVSEIDTGKLDPQNFQDWIVQAFKRSPQKKAVNIALHAWKSKINSNPEVIVALFLPAEIDGDGNLHATGMPFIPFDVFSINNQVYINYELYKKIITENYIDISILPWGKAVDAAIKIYQAVLKIIKLENFGYIHIHIPYITDKTNIQYSRHIKTLYDNILQSSLEFPLLETLCRGVGTEKTVPSEEDTFLSRMGYPNRAYPLTEQQRLVTRAAQILKEGEILAINGPPGTGKTKLLVTLIANELVNAVLSDAASPPVSIVVSANNRAVTNVIADFDQPQNSQGIRGHWIPWVKNFGSYFSSSGSQELHDNPWHTQDFFTKAVSQENIGQACEAVLGKGKDVFNIHFEKLDDLHVHIKKEIHKISEALRRTIEIINARNTYLEVLKKEFSIHSVHDTQNILEQMNICLNILYEHCQNPGHLKKLFSKYINILGISPDWKIIFDKHWPDCYKSLVYDEDPTIIYKKANIFRDSIKKYVDVILNIQHELCTFFSLEERTELQKADYNFKKIDALLDITHRYNLFWLAVHYWEVSWCMASEEAKSLEKKVTGKGAETLSTQECRRLWQLRMMLTPCAVFTMYMLPKYFSVQDEKPSMLYNGIDWLFVDEAGQASPEVGAASFALAKRAVVMGDTAQIPPINKMSYPVDSSNARQAGLNPDLMEENGQLHSTGNVLRMAQCASPFWPEKAQGLERGLFLKEHFRCLPSIIEYCNKTFYKGILSPQRTGEPKLPDIAPMLGLHVGGNAERCGESWRNAVEAGAVAAWIATYQEIICDTYKKPLSECIAVLSPYRAQARLITEELKTKEVLDNITIDTVHALQGGQRPIILFSPTMTTDAKGQKDFILTKNIHILNVAVSRSQDNFILIGDMILPLKMGKASAYGCLGHMLEIQSFPPQCGFIGIPGATFIRMLKTTEDHTGFLETLLREQARKRIVFYSPWAKPKVVENLSLAIRQCIQRGVKIEVIYDINKMEEEYGMKEALRTLGELGVLLSPSKNLLHAKMVYCDSHTAVCGSFNWLSANREEFAQIERSIVYQPHNIEYEIEELRKECGVCL